MAGSIHKTLRQKLKALVGAEFVFDEFNELKRFAVDGIAPRVAAAPADAEQMAQVVATLAEENLSMTARGGGTGMGYGLPPERLDVLLLTSRLDRVVRLDPERAVVTVGAGIRLDELEHRLAPHGLMLPLNPPSTDLATLGGVAACNASGPRRLRYGTLRELIAGVRFVDGRGEMVGSNGHGDLARRLVGSLGQAGVTVEFTVRLSPRPKKLRALLAAYAELAPALEGVERLRRVAEAPVFLELVGPEALSRMNPLPEGVDYPFAKFALAVGVEGDKAPVEQAIEIYRAELAATRPASLTDLDHGIEWELDYILQELYAESSGVLIRVELDPAQLGELFTRVIELDGPSGLSVGRMAHAGLGIAHLVLRPDEDLGWPKELPRAVSHIRELAKQLHGKTTVLQAPSEVKAHLPIFDLDPEETRDRQELQNRWDPRHLFNPGRVPAPPRP